MVTTPAITNAPRRATYQAVASAGPFSIPFPVFSLSADDLYLTINGFPLSGAGAIVQGSQPISDFYGQPRTWIDATLTLSAPITGLLVIQGHRAPRRESQLAEGRGIPARDLNLELNLLTALLREAYDRMTVLESQVRILKGDDEPFGF